jgi:hypothetical protein
MSGGQLKVNFYVLNNFTKQGTCQNMLGFRRDGVEEPHFVDTLAK